MMGAITAAHTVTVTNLVTDTECDLHGELVLTLIPGRVAVLSGPAIVDNLDLTGRFVSVVAQTEHGAVHIPQADAVFGMLISEALHPSIPATRTSAPALVCYLPDGVNPGWVIE